MLRQSMRGRPFEVTDGRFVLSANISCFFFVFCFFNEVIVSAARRALGRRQDEEETSRSLYSVKLFHSYKLLKPQEIISLKPTE